MFGGIGVSLPCFVQREWERESISLAVTLSQYPHFLNPPFHHTPLLLSFATTVHHNHFNHPGTSLLYDIVCYHNASPQPLWSPGHPFTLDTPHTSFIHNARSALSIICVYSCFLGYISGHRCRVCVTGLIKWRVLYVGKDSEVGRLWRCKQNEKMLRVYGG